MTQKTISIMLLLLLSAAWAYPQKNKVDPNGYNKFYYGNGQLSSEGPMKNGKPDGYWKTYYVNGLLKSEGNRVKHKLDSTWVFYNEQGDTTKKINYHYGVRNGYSYTYASAPQSENPNPVVSKELFVQGLKQGKAHYYRKDGSLKRTAVYKNGKKHGYEKHYAQDGRIVVLNEYRNGYRIENQEINRLSGNGAKVGTWIDFHANGEIKRVENYVNGQLQGLSRLYDEHGNLQKTQDFQQGKLLENSNAEKAVNIDVQEERFADGQLKRRGGYVDGKPVGLHQEFDTAGHVTASLFYDFAGNLTGKGIVDKDGNKQGLWKWYYTSGKLKSQGHYKDDKRNGKWLFLFENGRTEQTGHYNKGRYQGQWKWFFPDGGTKRVENYLNGRHDGIYKEFDRSGKRIVEGQYLDDYKSGQWRYEVGDQLEKGKYKLGNKTGTWKHYYPDGTLKFTGDYIAGREEGRHLHYYPSGKIRLEAFYESGRKEHTWTWYAEDGIPLKSITYKKGKEVRIDGMRLK